MSADLLARLREDHGECPSDFALDRWVAGELNGPSRDALDAHVEACALCIERVRTRKAGSEMYPNLDARRILARLEGGAAAPAETWSDRVRARFSGWSLAFTALALAVAACGLVAFNQQRPEWTRQQAEVSGVRREARLSLRAHRLRGQHSEPVLSGERFAPGDRLRFEIDTPFEGFASIVGTEAGGALYQAWPLGASESAKRLAAGQKQLLEGAVALDDSGERDVLYLVHCPLAAGVPQCTTRGKAQPPQCQSSCSLSPLTLDKRP